MKKVSRKTIAVKKPKTKSAKPRITPAEKIYSSLKATASSRKKTLALISKFYATQKKKSGAFSVVSSGDDSQNLITPPRASVAPQVIDLIATKAQENNAPKAKIMLLVSGDESLNLETDLKINPNGRTRLSTDYTDISESYQGAEVGPVASKNATTVALAINLVHKQANTK